MSVFDKISDLSVDWFDCPYCGAGLGHWCKTKSGRMATWLHADRARPIQNLIFEAYKEGMDEEKHMAAWRARVQREREERLRRMSNA